MAGCECGRSIQRRQEGDRDGRALRDPACYIYIYIYRTLCIYIYICIYSIVYIYICIYSILYI